MTTTDRYIETLVQKSILSPAARSMHPQDALDQYNEAHGLTVNDEDFLIHPDVVETTIEINGETRRGWAYRSNRQVSSDTPDLKMLQGCDRLSRELGARILRF
ncbi:hypothetical protein [Corynebacterium sp. A21]|uniref:hypothetical protein n=1 Tax=Corynebacterium sp. A21 TaxID=3457318 RepID=UPI003FD02615